MPRSTTRTNNSTTKRLTRIVATIGPASSSESALRKLILAGVDVFRLNFSHGSHEDHGAVYQRIREVSRDTEHTVAVLQDLSGPKLRIKNLNQDHIHLNVAHPYRLEKDLDIGDERIVGFLDEGWMDSVKIGDRVVLGDGIISLKITGKDSHGFDCRILSGGILRSRAGLSFPDSKVALGAMMPKDWNDLKFGLSIGVDFVALSFVQGPEDLVATRKFIGKRENPPLLIAKIERIEAVERMDEILEAADGVMVARGDLGISLPVEKVPTIQKRLIRSARERGKFCITATQMLESMIESPMPTRAEVTDVANAVFDGTDAVMLSGETAVGVDPPRVVETMARIVVEAEASAKFSPLEHPEEDIESGIVQAVRLLVDEIHARIIFAPFTRGSTAARISRLRCGVPIIAGAPSIEAARRMRIRNGVFPIVMDNPEASLLKKLTRLIDYALASKLVRKGDRAVATGGLPLDKPGITNFLRALTIGEEL